MGTPDFAVESLRQLIDNNFDIVGVVTAPDKPAGRGQRLNESPVKKYAVSKGLKVLQPDKLKNPAFLNELESLKADLQIVVAFRMLPEVVWKMPRFGTFNLHGSLLPHYRGAAPINWAVINGDKETGVTTFFIQQEIDTGGIIFQEKVEIGDSDNAGIIHDKLMYLGAKLVVKTAHAIESGKTESIPQDTIKTNVPLKPAPKIFKEDCKINWQKDGQSIYNLIRGLSPYPAAWTDLKFNNDKILSLKIFESELIDNDELKPGEIDSDHKTYLSVGCGDGALNLKSIQLAGKKRMSVDEFLRGNTVTSCHCI